MIIHDYSTYTASGPCVEPVPRDVRSTGPCDEPVPGAGFFITQKLYIIFEKFQKNCNIYAKIYIVCDFYVNS